MSSETNRFVEFWNEEPRRIFPDYRDDIEELRFEAGKPEPRNAEVVMDRKDGITFLSLFDFEGGHIADTLGYSGSVAVMCPESLIAAYKRQNERSLPLFRFYRIAASVADKIGIPHPKITSAPAERFDDEEEAFAHPDGTIYFRIGTIESADTYLTLFMLIRRIWQVRKYSAVRVLDPKQEDDEAYDSYTIDAYAFGILMLDVLFQIEPAYEMFPEDMREALKARTEALAEELY